MTPSSSIHIGRARRGAGQGRRSEIRRSNKVNFKTAGSVLLVGGVFFATLAIMGGRFPVYQTAPVAAAMAAQLLPVLAVMALARPVPRARFWIAIWSLVFFVSDVIQFLVARFLGENLWYFSFSHPIEDALLLWAYSHWQTRPEMRLTFRLAIPLLVVVSSLIAITAGEFNTFKSFSSPFRSLILMSAIVYTLISRWMQEKEPVADRDWLWTSVGVMLYFGAYVLVEPVANSLIPEHMGLARFVYVVKGCVDLVAYILIWKGMRCPVPTSSGSTWAPSLPSR